MLKELSLIHMYISTQENIEGSISQVWAYL